MGSCSGSRELHLLNTVRRSDSSGGLRGFCTALGVLVLPRLNNNASEGDCSGPRESRTCSTQFGVLAQEGGQAVFLRLWRSWCCRAPTIMLLMGFFWPKRVVLAPPWLQRGGYEVFLPLLGSWCWCAPTIMLLNDGNWCLA